MEHAIQIFAAVLFLAVGLSHLLQPAAWVDFFQKLAERGRTGAILEGFLYLPFGALIVGFHNVWRWPDVLLTLIGWAQVLKGTLRFVAPDVGLRAMRMVLPRSAVAAPRCRRLLTGLERLPLVPSLWTVVRRLARAFARNNPSGARTRATSKSA